MKKLEFVGSNFGVGLDEKVAKITMQYSREWKSWGIFKRNKNGDQLEDGVWVHSKKEALDQKKEFEKEYGLKR